MGNGGAVYQAGQVSGAHDFLGEVEGAEFVFYLAKWSPRGDYGLQLPEGQLQTRLNGGRWRN